MMKNNRLFLATLCALGCSSEPIAVDVFGGGTVQEPFEPSDKEGVDNPVDSPRNCLDTCDGSVTVCNALGQLLVCQPDPETGCLKMLPTPCPDGEVCKAGACQEQGTTPTCTDACVAGAKLCSPGGLSLACELDATTGCFALKAVECGADEVCVHGICSPKGGDVDACQDACPTEGASQCDGANGVQTCGNFDDDACLEWSVGVPCREGLSCAEGKCACQDACAPHGKTECTAGGYRACSDTNGDGCLEWTAVVSCGARTCIEGQCACSHACDSGARICDGAGYKSCTADAQGCRVWSGVTACPAGCDAGACKPEVVMAPTRYLGGRVNSPVTAYSVSKMQAIAAQKARIGNQFMKVGDSHFDGSDFMTCFMKTVDLAGATHLNGVIDAFKTATPNPFSRLSGAAKVGKTLDWVLGVLGPEISAMNPRFAFIDFGSNDMGWFGYTRPTGTASTGYFYTLQWYYRNYRKVLEQLMAEGVIPILIGTGVQSVTSYQGSPLGDLNPYHFVSIFSAVGRGLAELYQIPFLDLHDLQLQEPLKSNNYGLSTDNLHAKSYAGGCNFSTTGMAYGHNARNRYALALLDQAWRTVVRGETAPDAPVLFAGSGTQASPYEISSLPYTHAGNTTLGAKHFATYSCASTREDGPEIYYKLTVTQPTKVRAFAVSAAGIDVDLYLLGALDNNACKARGDVWVESTLSAGTHYFVVDTYGSAAGGEYLFGVVACDSGDGLCASATTGG